MVDGVKIAVIDADIIGRNKHRFSNLVCMKISGYYKQQGATVVLKTDYENLEIYDKVFISKVFTDTEIPGEPEDKTGKRADNISEWYKDNEFLKRENIFFGGTGFYYDNAPPLDCKIEHQFPDYSLYEQWVQKAIADGAKPEEFEYYTKYSIGFATRGCFRKCAFCVNKKYNKAIRAGYITEFLDETRPYICLLDDNFFACKEWPQIIQEIKATGKRFQFKQGLDERLLTPEIVKEMSTWKYKREFIFAFDNIADKEIIERKLQMIYLTCPDFKRGLKFYVFCGFDRNEKYSEEFWQQDIEDLFERIFILVKYGAKPYIMRHENVYKTEHSAFYASVAAWCNQPAMFTSFSFRLFCMCRGMSKKGYAKYKRDINGYLQSGGQKLSIWRTMEQYALKYPQIAKKYFDLDTKGAAKNE